MADNNRVLSVRFVPILLVVSIVCIAAAAVFVALGGGGSGDSADKTRELNQLVALSQKIPAQAQAAPGNPAAKK